MSAELIEVKSDIKELEVKSHNLSKRVYDVEKSTAVLSSEFTHMRENVHDKFQVMHDTMKAFNERDEQQMQEFRKFQKDVEAQLNEKKIVGKVVYRIVQLWPLWSLLFLFLVFLDAHKFASHFVNIF